VAVRRRHSIYGSVGRSDCVATTSAGDVSETELPRRHLFAKYPFSGTLAGRFSVCAGLPRCAEVARGWLGHRKEGEAGVTAHFFSTE
jgi:hypothetical protein